MVADRASHALQRLLGRVSTFHIVVKVDLPKRRLCPVPDPPCRLPFANRVPTGFVTDMVVPARDREVRLRPDHLHANLEPRSYQPAVELNTVGPRRGPTVYHRARSKPLGVIRVRSVFIGHLAYALSRVGEVSVRSSLVAPRGIVVHSIRGIGHAQSGDLAIQQQLHILLTRGVPTYQSMGTEFPELPPLRSPLLP